MIKNSKLLKSIYVQTVSKKLFFLLIFFFLLFFIFLINIYLFILQENFNYKKENINFNLYGKKYAHEFDDLQFKIFNANKLKRNILLGSSTSMTFRPDYLGVNYFNSSKGNIKISEIDFFLKKIEYEPENIIIFFDPYHFNKNFPEISKNNNFMIYNLKNFLYVSNIEIYYNLQKKILIFSKYGQVIRDLKKNFIKIYSKKKDNKKIGLNAKLYDSGFRKDGSFKYPDKYSNEIKVNENENFDLDTYSKTNLYIGKNEDFIKNYQKKLFFLISKNQKYKKNITIVLNTVESNFLKKIKSNDTYNQFLQKYKNVCKYLVENGVKCIDKVEFVNENNINSSIFYDPFHYRYQLSNLILRDVLKYTK